MKIFFCDVCNESIPVKLVQEGRIHTVKGKVICPKCLPFAEGAPDAAPLPGAASAVVSPRVADRPPRPVSSLGAMGCVIGAAAAGGAFYLYSEIGELREDLRESTLGLPSFVSKVEEERTRVGNRDKDVEKRLDAFSGQLEKSGRAVDAIGDLRRDFNAEAGRWEDRKLKLEAAFGKALENALEPLRSQSVRLETTLAKSDAEVQRLRSELARLTGRVESLTGRGEIGAPVAVPAPSGAAAGDAVALKDLPAAVAKQVELLADADASKVWAALTELSNTPDPRVIPYVIPTLGHSDAFVRHAATMLLGDLNAKEAVEKLIQALGDEEAFVREGAYSALRKITRQNLRFDAHGTREQRAEWKSAWEKWWQANRDKVLGS